MSYFIKSPWVIHYDGSSCNGCDIEVLACLTPIYDVERFGIINTGNPKHADMFLITGSINEQNREVVQNIYNQIPDPKVVVAIGICATSGGVFSECYNVGGGVDKVLPVDVYVPGCAARPESIIDGVVKALGVLEEKRSKFKTMMAGLEYMHFSTADVTDAQAILSLQKLAYQSEAELYNDFTMSPLTQTFEQIKADFSDKVFLKAEIEGVIVGSVRAYVTEDTCYIGRLIVNPLYQNMGIGRKLLHFIEKKFAGFDGVKRFEVFTGKKRNHVIYFYRKSGYKAFKSARVSEIRERVYMEKPNC
jgi:ech hydrogenase subunit C